MSCCLVVYDIANAKRLRKVARVMQAYGVRVQKSVFECDLSDTDRENMLQRAEEELVEEEDQVRLYRLSHRSIHHARILGVEGARLPEAAVVI